MQKSATHATKSFQLLRGFAHRYLVKGLPLDLTGGPLPILDIFPQKPRVFR